MIRIRGAALRPGDLVGVVAPGFAVERQALQRGLARLTRMGFDVRVGRHVRARCGYLAGTDEQRAEDLGAMLLDPDVRAVWFARGGYGTARLLDRLPWRRVRRHDKLLVGYSDATALFQPWLDRVGGRCLYGPVVTELGADALFHRASLERGLRGERDRWTFPARNVLVPGRARGPVVGGTLSLLAHLCGTPWAPRFRNRILFLEEVGEATYRIDRALTQLGQAGALRGVRGVLLGSFQVPRRTRFPPDRRLLDVLRDHLEPLGVPVVRGLPAGHCAGKRTLPLGATADLDSGTRRLDWVG